MQKLRKFLRRIIAVVLTIICIPLLLVLVLLMAILLLFAYILYKLLVKFGGINFILPNINLSDIINDDFGNNPDNMDNFFDGYRRGHQTSPILFFEFDLLLYYILDRKY